MMRAQAPGKGVGYILLLALAATMGCSHAWQWPPLATPRPTAEQFPQDASLIVDYRRSITQRNTTDWEIDTHEVIALLREAGRKEIERYWTPHPGLSLTRLRVRVHSPDGVTREVDTAPFVRSLDRTRRLIPFGSVAVGSLVEIDVASNARSEHGQLSEIAASSQRTLRFELTIDTEPKMQTEVRVLHANASPERTDDNTGHHVRVVLTDVPAYTHELWQGPSILSQPWIWVRYGPRPPHPDDHDGWITELADMARFQSQYKRDNPEHRIPGYDMTTGTLLQRVERAVGAVRDNLAYLGDGGGIGIARSSATILSSRQATTYERGLVTGRMLASGGVRFDFALGSTTEREIFDRRVPLLAPFDRLLVRVPVQPGIEHELWLDPACDRCEAGEVEPALIDAEAVVLMWPEWSDAARFDVSFARIAARPPQTADGSQVSHDVQIGPDGAIEDSIVQEISGDDAVAEMQRDRTASEAQRLADAESHVHAIMPQARLVAKSFSCDAAHATCRRTLRYTASYASMANDVMVLPLRLLVPWPLPEKPSAARTHDVYLQRAMRWCETATFHLPLGYTASSDFAPLAGDAGSIAVSAAIKASGRSAVVERCMDLRPGHTSARDFAAAQQLVIAFVAMRDESIVLRR